MRQEFFEPSVSSQGESFQLFFGPEVEADALDIDCPFKFFVECSTVETEEYGMRPIGPLFAFLSAFKALGIGLVLKHS